MSAQHQQRDPDDDDKVARGGAHPGPAHSLLVHFHSGFDSNEASNQAAHEHSTLA